MVENGLEVKVTVEDFSTKEPDEKLNILYQAVLAQQKTCGSVTKKFHGRILDLETNRKIGKAKLAGIVIGLSIAGGGVGSLIIKIILGG